MRIAIIGNGKMGKTIAGLAPARGHTVHTVVGRLENVGGRGLTAERLAGADVAIEFTRPDAAVANLERLIGLRIPTVTGTTGWSESLLEVSELVRQRAGALLHTANFSIGVHLFLRASRDLARYFLGRGEFDVSIHEEHHTTKVDIPSGTALMLQHQLRPEDPERRFPITSARLGEVLGTHTLSYSAPHEIISLRHVTLSRDVFAIGALAAAEWLPGRTGVYTFDEMLFGESG
jgi:4-hydroxy-tetrahydrodipicolinate reductase